MGHLLETVNPEAAAQLREQAESVKDLATDMAAGESIDAAPDPIIPVSAEGLPGIGDIVLYQPRRGSVRRGRNRVAALVTWVHPGTRLLDLAIVYEASDTLDDQKVPEAVGEERGWVLKDRAPLIANGNLGAADVAAFNKPGAITYATEPGLQGLQKEISDLRALVLGEFTIPERSVLDMIDDLDKRLDALAFRPAPKKRGRPKKPKAPKTPNPDEPAGQ